MMFLHFSLVNLPICDMIECISPTNDHVRAVLVDTSCCCREDGRMMKLSRRLLHGKLLKKLEFEEI
jgi:hypothetical protein